jgi:hypothetical protein
MAGGGVGESVRVGVRGERGKFEGGVELLESEEVLDWRYYGCLIALRGKPGGQEGWGLLLIGMRRLLDTFYGRRQILVKLRYLDHVTHRPLLPVLFD